MSSLHRQLMQRSQWYSMWHNLPDVQAAHWAVFTLVSTLLTLVAAGRI